MQSLLSLLLVTGFVSAEAQAGQNVTVLSDERGYKLQVDGEDFFMRGMNWGYVPKGENYAYDFWGKPDAFIEGALRREMGLLKDMGVNTIRLYPGIPTRWVEWIYHEYGIFTVLNPTVGRYGANIDGVWIPVINYEDPRSREFLIQETVALVEEYKDTDGILMWMLGNENNYGLVWSSFEIEALPAEEQGSARALHLYTLMGEVIDAVKAIDDTHPVSMANGDLQYIDLIAEHCSNLDVMGSNVYRGRSSGDLFDRVGDELGVPFFYSEFGADSYDARRGREDHVTQADYLLDQWQEIYEHAYGNGRSGTAVGGMIFQWSDGWWKTGQEVNLDVQNPDASWPNRAYIDDYVEGGNNMNEEWFGITAKGNQDDEGNFEILPRAAYYLIRDAWSLNPYAPGSNQQTVRDWYSRFSVNDYTSQYTADKALAAVQESNKATLDDLRMELSTFATGGTALQPEGSRPVIDHMESFYLDFGVRPSEKIEADLVLNVLGNVADNRINELFYENRGRDLEAVDENGEPIDLEPLERVRIYKASVDWEGENLDLFAYYREGHYHWGYEGDFFGLYPEANYGPNLDIYDAIAPVGVELEGKKALENFKVAAGPQIYWGANPTVMPKYYVEKGRMAFGLIHQEDITQQGSGASQSSVVPEQIDRRSTAYLSYKRGKAHFEVGGIMAGTPQIGQTYRSVEKAGAGEESWLGSGFNVLSDEIRFSDTLGAKAKLRISGKRVYWYAQGAYKGLVSDGGGDPTITFTGWTMKEDGRGNHFNGLTGVALILGDFTLAPNALYQKPLVGPMPAVDGAYDPTTGVFYPGLAPRNVLTDPFAVLGNRETIGFEFLLAFDPTPATWMWQWDNPIREDATFSGSLDFVYRHQPTRRDSNLGWSAEGFLFAFPVSPPARDVWDVTGRFIVNPGGAVRILGMLYGGQGQGTGDDGRLVTRYGGEASAWINTTSLKAGLKIDDWGPFDFHRQFNQTYPVQLNGEVAFGLSRPKLYLPTTRAGFAINYRVLDQYSDGFNPLMADPDGQSTEWEIGTFLNVSL